MNHRRVLVIAALLAPFAFASAARPAAPYQRERVNELEAENKNLRTQVANLEKELTAANQAVAKAQHAAAPAPAPAPTPAEKPAITYHSISDVLHELPAALHPDPKTGWAKPAMVKVRTWLDHEPLGHRFEATLPAASVRVVSNPFHQSGDKRQPWLIIVEFESAKQQFMGQTLTQETTGQTDFALVMEADAATKKKADALPQGTPIHVSGRVSWVDLQSDSGGSTHWRARISLAESKLQSPLLESHAAAATQPAAEPAAAGHVSP